MAARCLDCHELIARGSRCRNCTNARRSRWDQADFRRRVLRRDRRTCRDCGATEATTELVADHVVPVDDGGTHATSNGRTLCVACHRKKTNRDVRLVRAGNAARELTRRSR